jgi:4a-hydroxytetrahydrobiopterin dehydratase
MSNNWVEKDNKLSKTYKFDSFMDAINWMSKAAVVIDEFNHHPEWSNLYNKVNVILRTHDAGYIVTNKDRKLAQLLDDVDL